MSTAARTYPYGRTRRDDARQPFISIKLAKATAEILEHMTGDRCEVISRGPTWHLIIRVSGEKAGRG